MIEDVDEAAVELEAVSDMETLNAEVEDDTVVEFETASGVDTDATAEDEDNVLVEFELAGNADVDATAEDENKLILELEAVSDAEEDPEAVPTMAFARRLPWIELLELDMEFILEELEIGALDNEGELERVLLDDTSVELPTLLEDDAKVERTLLDELDETVLELDLLLLVADARLRLEDGVGDADRLFEVELNRDEVEDGEAEELPTVLLLLLILVELLLDLVELLLGLIELLLFLPDVVVLLLVLILVSEALNELDVVDVTFLVTFLLAVSRSGLSSIKYVLTYLVDVTVLDTVAVTTCFEGVGALMVLFTVFVEILRRDWQ